MTIVLNGDTGITTPTYGGNVTAEYQVPVTAFKNRIINGEMTIDQRNAGASVSPAVGSTYTLDRWVSFRDSSGGAYTVQQNAGAVTPPSGFTKYFGLTVTSTDTFGSAGTQYNVTQFVEGFNIADLAWGTASAAPITLSFWVRSSLTGTFAGGISNSDGSRSYIFTYTIASANTWTYCSVTIPGDTTGTWLTTNGIGIRTIFSLGTGTSNQGTAGAWSSSYTYNTSGAVRPLGTNGATFYITGVQLEKGSTATSFDYRPYGTELALCQRYYQSVVNNGQNGGFAGTAQSNGLQTAWGSAQFKITMRSAPTVVLYDAGSNAPGTVTQFAVADAIPANAGGIGTNGFNSVTRTSGSFSNTLGYVVSAGYTASSEL